MARKKRKRRKNSTSMLTTAFKLLRIGSFVAPALLRYKQVEGVTTDPMRKIGYTIQSYAGLESSGKFNTSLLTQMWLPYLMTSLTTYGIPKINGILRRL